MTTEQVTREAAFPVSTILRWAAEGRVPAISVDGVTCLRRADVEAMIVHRGGSTTPDPQESDHPEG